MRTCRPKCGVVFLIVVANIVARAPWTSATGNDAFEAPAGCPAGGSINRAGWTLDHEVTGTDGLRTFNIAYRGVEVATSMKLVEWHTDYGSSGYRVATGCGGGGGGFPIYPFGETLVADLIDGATGVIGFEVVQDFRMGSWGATCNYRVEQHHQFFFDGRFRVVSGAFGKGCGTNTLYRPIVRIDLAVDGDAGDSVSFSDGRGWAQLTTEDYRVPYSELDHGPHATDSRGYYFKVVDAGGSGYHLELDQGQFPIEGAPQGRGADPFLYATLHHADEGDGDLAIIGACCNDDHAQGPEQYVDGESIDGENIVLWYVSQMITDVAGPDYYCWTVAGEPNPETYPCFTGPMLHPIADVLLQSPNAANGLFSDSGCDVCDFGMQAVADDFVVTDDVTIDEIVLWGGYHPDNIPSASDDFTVVFHQDNGGWPGPAVSTQTAVPSVRTATGVVLFGVDEYEYVLSLAEPVALGAGSYFIEVVNDTTGNTDDFFWETGDLDVGNGISGFAIDPSNAPGSSWGSSSGADLAVELHAVPLSHQIFSDDFEAGNTSAWSAAVP